MRGWPFLLLASACAGNLLGEAEHEFSAGQYAQAKATIEKIDASEYEQASARRRTEYSLYRGLIFGALGDRKEAVTWLGMAKQTEDQHPGSLGEDDQARLHLAEQQYGPLPVTAPPAPP